MISQANQTLLQKKRDKTSCNTRHAVHTFESFIAELMVLIVGDARARRRSWRCSFCCRNDINVAEVCMEEESA